MTTIEKLDESQRTDAFEQLRDQERRQGTIPRGTYEATLREVALIRRKDGSGWLLRLIVCTIGLGRYLVSWQGLSENPEDPFDLTDTQVRSVRRFADKMAIATPAPGEQIVEALRLMLNEPVTARVTQTPVGQQVTLMRDGVVVEPPNLEITGTALEAATEAAYKAHEKVLQGLAAARLGLAAAAEGCYELHNTEGWRALGFETLVEYLASPEVTISRTDFYRLVEIWSAYVLNGGVEPMQLQGAGPTKLEVPLPALAQGVVSADQAVADATTMTRKDLRAHYSELLGDDEEGDDPPAEPSDGDGEPAVSDEQVSEVARSLTAVLRRVLVEVGDPAKKRMSRELRQVVLEALELASDHGLDEAEDTIA
jgi:hypothetical protein